MGIFRIFFIGREIRKGIADPKNFAVEESFSFLKGFIFVFFFIGLAFIILFWILGFTSWIIGPYFFFKVLFYLAGIPFTIISIFLFKTLARLKKIVQDRLEKIQ